MLKVANGRVYDPKHRVDGEVRDVYYDRGTIVEPTDGPCEVFDASGCAVLPGGIDIHSHIAGEPLPLLREAGSPVVPTTRRLGEEYAHMGYTLAVNAAMPALAARHTFAEENAIPGLDTANLVWIGENPVLLELTRRGSDEELDQYLSWLLAMSGALGLKLINPCAGSKDGELPYFRLIGRLTDACARLRLPHPLHLHHPFLGRMDAFESVAETVERLGGRRIHLAHLQFYGYKKNGDGRTVSAAQELADLINAHPNVTCDVGAVVFGGAAAVTADTEFAKKLAKGRRGFRSEFWEADGEFGVLPLRYDPQNAMGATQFLTGLELLLRMEDPSRAFLTTDHPNGGPFTAYPYLIRLIMDRAFRGEELMRLNPEAVSRSAVPSIMREYTLYEVAQMTRSGPAAALGLPDRGHLGVGAGGGV
ncbi:MAG TPA: amidohydrolase family protein, partial [Clostridia bacterium]|nr:amidohydrolase family protein [Clostridia bacterium]